MENAQIDMSIVIINNQFLGALRPYTLYKDGEQVGEYRTAKQALRRALQLGASKEQIRWIG